MSLFKVNITLAACTVFSCTSIYAQKHDTLQSVKVLTKKEINPAEQTVPVQSLNKTALEKLNSSSAAEAVKHFAGVTVKDYGGIGGLKTVSVRSLGANHTGVSYDGLLIGDAQGGQIDLGKFPLENTEEIRLYTGTVTDPLSPARAYSTASLLAIRTSSADFSRKEHTAIQVGLKQGSFGLIQPSFSASAFIGKKFRTAVSGYYQYAKGNYPFASYENKDSTIKRSNSDIKAFRLEYDAAYRIADSNTIELKAFHYDSKRGLPGAIVLFNGADALQRLDDRNNFAQVRWKNRLSSKSSLLLSSKFSKDYKYYLDPAYLNIYHQLENEFHQQEIYFSAAYSYRFTKMLSMALASDYFNSRLKRTDMFAADFAQPKRNYFLENIALTFKKQSLELGANLLYTVINEQTAAGPAGKNLHEFMPAFSASVQPFSTVPLRLRGFYKKVFRAPTFDDLYYTNIGNTNLRPEYADLFDLGLTYHTHTDHLISEIIFTGDAYYNKVKDKILAMPRQNLFQWSMQNIGRVDIRGIDMALHLRSSEIEAVRFNADAAYTYQFASDISDKNSVQYKKQLPYTPAHSGSAGLGVQYKKLSVNWNALFSSYRYRQGEQISENLLQGWVINDLSVVYSYNPPGNYSYRFVGEVNNIFNKQYEIIKYYPMPGLNYRAGIVINFKK